MADIVPCPHCGMRIIPTAASACPACGKELAAPVAAPPPPPKKRRRHPVLFVIFLAMVVLGFLRYHNRVGDDYEAIVVDLALIWLGCLGIVCVNVMSWRKAK
jgi:hypothetical protein